MLLQHSVSVKINTNEGNSEASPLNEFFSIFKWQQYCANEWNLTFKWKKNSFELKFKEKKLLLT